MPPALWAWLTPGLAAVLLYAITAGFAFVWDDLDLIVRNTALHGPGWTALLMQDFWQSTGGGTGMWRPLVTASYRLDWLLGGGSPAQFHMVNVVAHLIASLLVVKLASERGLPPIAGFAAGMFYATAPALSEAIAWIAGRTDAFVALFTLAALLLARRWRAGGEPLALVGVALAVAAALLSKETALVLPLLLAADLADQRSEPATGAATRSPWLPLALSIGVTLAWALAHRTFVAASERPADPGALSAAAALVWAHLAWLAPWAPHAPLLPLWQAPSPLMAGVAWGALALVGVALVRVVQRRVPFALPIALVFAPLLPVAAASLLESGVRFAERALVLPVVGVALFAGALLVRTPVAQRGLAVAVTGLLVALQCIAVMPAIAAWRDEESRIRRIAEVRPRDADALLGMADLLSTLGRTEEAQQWIARAEAVAPASADANIARASLAFRAGQPDVALAAAERALASTPDDLGAGVIRVRSLVVLGRAADAVPLAEALMAAHPGEAAAEGAFGVALSASGQTVRAATLLAGASARLLDDAGLAWEWGRCEIARGDVAAARVAFDRAVTADPGFYEAWLGLADTRMKLGERAAAEDALQHAAALPGAADGRAGILRERWNAAGTAKSLPGAPTAR
ncbi:MAG: tetratricopeptide repeat protein [Candidatus Eisenbacteria bacterium]|nr:tetratricopeptide repeat protein [Candidatus Eisenbacteria bacterium]